MLGGWISNLADEPRRRSFVAFVMEGGEPLARFAEFEALRLQRARTGPEGVNLGMALVREETPDAVTQRQQLEAGSVDIAMQISNDAAKGMGGNGVTVEQVSVEAGT